MFSHFFRWLIDWSVNVINSNDRIHITLIFSTPFLILSHGAGSCLTTIFIIARYNIIRNIWTNIDSYSASENQISSMFYNYSFYSGVVLILAIIGHGSFFDEPIILQWINPFVRIGSNFFVFLLMISIVLDIYLEAVLVSTMKNMENIFKKRMFLFWINIGLMIFGTIISELLNNANDTNEKNGLIILILTKFFPHCFILTLTPYFLTYQNLFNQNTIKFN